MSLDCVFLLSSCRILPGYELQLDYHWTVNCRARLLLRQMFDFRAFGDQTLVRRMGSIYELQT